MSLHEKGGIEGGSGREASKALVVVGSGIESWDTYGDMHWFGIGSALY